jgi:hypothetical protein
MAKSLEVIFQCQLMATGTLTDLVPGVTPTGGVAAGTNPIAAGQKVVVRHWHFTNTSGSSPDAYTIAIIPSGGSPIELFQGIAIAANSDDDRFGMYIFNSGDEIQGFSTSGQVNVAAYGEIMFLG